jgi:hypothetical protein
MAELSGLYQLSFEVRPKYLYAELRARSISEEIIRGYVAELVAKSRESGRDLILLYRDIPAIMAAHQMFSTVSESLDALRGKKLALVNPHASIDDDLEFGLTVGQNRGGNYQRFTNIPDAEAWLLA